MFELELPFDCKELGPTGEFEGWASTYDVDLGKDKVLPGAFATTLRKTKGQVPVLFNHDRSKIAGVGIEAQEDQRGLYVKARLALGTQLGREIHELMSMGALKGLSIGYTIPAKGMVMDGPVRLLKQVELLEYSATPFPMNTQAQVNRVKCISEMTTRDLEDQLRDVFGLSQKEAKRVIAEGFKSLLTGKRDVDPVEQDEEEKDEQVRAFLKEMRTDQAAQAMLAAFSLK
jgi:HK97 family phage prohead protease